MVVVMVVAGRHGMVVIWAMVVDRRMVKLHFQRVRSGHVGFCPRVVDVTHCHGRGGSRGSVVGVEGQGLIGSGQGFVSCLIAHIGREEE